MDVRRFIEQIAAEKDGDYTLAFKLLGFVVFITEEGNDDLLSGELISTRTYARWMSAINRAGWGNLVADARLRKELRDYLWIRYAGLPLDLARDKTVETIRRFLSDSEARSLKAISRQESAGVKGMAAGREVNPSALDDGADGGSLGKATAPATTGMQNE